MKRLFTRIVNWLHNQKPLRLPKGEPSCDYLQYHHEKSQEPPLEKELLDGLKDTPFKWKE